MLVTSTNVLKLASLMNRFNNDYQVTIFSNHTIYQAQITYIGTMQLQLHVGLINVLLIRNRIFARDGPS